MLNSLIGSLSKHDVDGSENVIGKCNFSSAIIFQLFKLFMLEKCFLTILELNWNQRLGHKRTKLNICRHMLTSSTQLQNRSFHVVERTRTSSKCQKMKNARAKRAKILFHCQICKFVGFSLSSSLWLLKLPNLVSTRCAPKSDGLIFQTSEV